MAELFIGYRGQFRLESKLRAGPVAPVDKPNASSRGHAGGYGGRRMLLVRRGGLRKCTRCQRCCFRYAGGTVANPTYEQVCTKLTGHAEVCQITFDPEKISYLRILEIFMKTHDPTTLNKQGPDRGPQYRSSIFYHNDEQKQQAEELLKRLNEEKVYDDKIVTKLEPLTAFYRAEEYHQDYYRKNPGDGYCMMNARPKVMKLKKVMQELEKKDKAAK